MIGQVQNTLLSESIVLALLFFKTGAGTSARGETYPETVGHIEYERVVSAVRSALGEEAFAAARTRGREKTLEQAIVYALERWERKDI